MGWRREGALQIDSLTKVPGGGLSMCACGHFVYVCVLKVFLLQVVLWWQLEGSLLPLNPLLSGCLQGGSMCILVPVFFFVNTHLHTNKVARPFTGICLPPTWLSPSITPNPVPRPPLSRKTPAVKVTALPTSPLCCIKASLCSLDTNTLSCFLIICLHHRMHFYSTHGFSGFECIISPALRELHSALIH